MVMFLTLFFMSLLAVAVCAAAFGLATRGVDAPPAVQPGRHAPADVPARFFARPAIAPPLVSQVPIELLLSDIERHVRLEQAAAEAFLELPSRDALHAHSRSPLAN
jgi:hypothetical protein